MTDEARAGRFERLCGSGDPLLREIGGQLRQGQIRASDLLHIPEYRAAIDSGMRRLFTAANNAATNDAATDYPAAEETTTGYPATEGAAIGYSAIGYSAIGHRLAGGGSLAAEEPRHLGGLAW